MKNCIKHISQILIGGALALVLSVSAVVPAQAYDIGTILSVGQIAIGILEAWTTDSSNRQAYREQMLAIWRDPNLTTAYNNGYTVTISGDELARAVYELNQAGIPCEVHSATVNGHSFYYIKGTGQIFYPNQGSFAGTGIDITNKAYCTQGTFKIYISPYDSSPYYLSWLKTYVYNIQSYVDTVEDKLSTLATKLDTLHTDLAAMAGSPMVSFLQDSYACGYWSRYDGGEFPTTEISRFSADIIVSLLNTFMPGHSIHTTNNDYERWTDVERDYEFLTAYVENGCILVEVKYEYASNELGYSTMRLCNAYNHYFAVQPDPTSSLLSTISNTLNNLTVNAPDVTVDVGSLVDNIAVTVDTSDLAEAIEHMTCHHDYRSMMYLDGDSVSFESEIAGEPLDDLTIQIKPGQDYNGYDHPWSGGEGKNLLSLSDVTFERVTDDIAIDPIPAGDPFTFSAVVSSEDTDKNGCVVWFLDGNKQLIISKTVNRSQDGERIYTTPFPLRTTCEYVRFYASDSWNAGEGDTATFSDMQIESGAVATAYEPYENICPITAHNSATITHNGTDTVVNFPASVYGGTLDLSSGVLTSTMAVISSYNGETLPGLWYSDRDVYAVGTTPSIGAQVVYVTNSPVTYEVTPVTLYTARGSNVIYCNCGSLSLRILDGSALTDMGYTLVVCQKCGQVQPLFSYTRLLDKLDDLESTLSNLSISVNSTSIDQSVHEVNNFTVDTTNTFNEVWYVGEDGDGNQQNLVGVAKDGALTMGKLLRFIWNAALKDIFNTGGGVDTLSDYYLTEGEESENVWGS